MSDTILLAVKGDEHKRRSVPRLLHDLAKLEARPVCLTVFSYECCSAIYENREHLEDWGNLLLVCLELGFRHLDAQRQGSRTDIRLTHTEHHRGLVDVVFKSQEGEAIADLLHAWTTDHDLPDQAGEMVGICTGNLAALHNLGPFSPRLRRAAIRFVEKARYKRLEGARVEKLIELLEHLQVTVKEMAYERNWVLLLSSVVLSPEGTRRLSHWYWELLVELAVLDRWGLEFEDADALEIAKSLIGTQEWDKLECWIGAVWMSFESASITGEDLEHSTLLLFRQRPTAAQRLEQWMERWSQQHHWKRIPESFQRILTRAHEAVQRQDAP